ncbi:CmcI family methyltransferase [Amphritea pacifica]|uniref:Class I SAM-dependent methyltransferase n=1 Tax=Amphritea pacifica TaxID=2811233 RepID=A0ABS2WCG7_9GAMM|nr:CmcI family methyltransferase [Amphritea pacifica]MBN0989414.1 class I SAM-dependent methyltransferase [Amphritea pacifica]
MHASSFENMKKCYQKYIVGSELEQRTPLLVLDVGGADVNGSYSDIFSGSNIQYLGADLAPGAGVSVVLDDPNTLPLEDSSVDIVISGQMLEHCEFFWEIFAEFVRVLKDDGYIFLIAPSSGPIHKFPVDCYRFYPDSYRALAKYTGCHLVEVWHDDRGPWDDLVGVFKKSEGVEKDSENDISLVLENNSKAGILSTEFDIVKGELPYTELLKFIHESILPDCYLEIGVRNGRSLSLASCDAVGVDPDPEITHELGDNTRVVSQTSDYFFEQAIDPVLQRKPDLVFIDGMHLFENVLRDFINVERVSGPHTVVVVDDIYPNHPKQAARERNTRVWTGDVWKLHTILKKYRPDLTLIPINTSPTGLLVILGLNFRNKVLTSRYNPIVREALYSLDTPDQGTINREGALSPSEENMRQLFQVIYRARRLKLPYKSQSEVYDRLLNRDSNKSSEKSKQLAMSVIVISYNMARELPRTLKSLSPPFQKNISVDDYEIIVVDNGSSDNLDKVMCQAISPNIRFIVTDGCSVSPVRAINHGLNVARGELVGVMIDGARMASPGLLNKALSASKSSPHAAIGTLAFHLGEDVQMKSVLAGYNQTVEDELLNSVGWEEDGYKLFDVSVFAGSSSGGWFDLPAETNALFLRANDWIKIGGYDERFQQPGGGLANLDTWRRVCCDSYFDVVMLLGEGTFHQFHGGTATNAITSAWDAFNKEYKSIRGCDYKRPGNVNVSYFGSIQDNQRASLLESLFKSLPDFNKLPTSNLEVQERSFNSKFPPSLLAEIQKGVMNTTYRNISFLKSPLDIGIYYKLFDKVLPKTVIEIGSKFGGSALWFADMLSAYGVESPKVLSIDIELLADFSDERIDFITGDAGHLDEVLSESLMNSLPRPMLIIEDSSHLYHHSMAVLNFFHGYLQKGDYIVVEDGVCAQFSESRYRVYDNGPNRAVKEFLLAHGDSYEIDTDLCDHYGINATYNPNGYLKRL